MVFRNGTEKDGVWRVSGTRGGREGAWSPDLKQSKSEGPKQLSAVTVWRRDLSA